MRINVPDMTNMSLKLIAEIKQIQGFQLLHEIVKYPQRVTESGEIKNHNFLP